MTTSTGDRPVISTSEELPPLSAEELAALRQIGQHWASSRPARRARSQRLPVDPALGRFRRPTLRRFGRVAQVEMFRAAPDELVAAPPAAAPESRLGRLLTAARRVVLGPPLPSTAIAEERMGKLVALAVLGSDLLSSVAYGPEAMLGILVLAGSTALGLSLPIAAALVVLMITLGVSYRQTIRAYPAAPARTSWPAATSAHGPALSRGQGC